MKHMKVLGLAAIAALGLTAFVGAGTASATTLATNSAGSIKYPAGTTIHMSLKSGTSLLWKATDGSTIATCTSATKHGHTDNETGTWVEITITIFSWSGCNQTTHTTATGKMKVMWSGEDTGAVVGQGSRWTLSIFGVSCTYGYGEGTILGSLTGGEAPELSINAAVPKVEGGFLCPAWAILIGQWVVTSPHSVHIVP